jgi:serine phosphatase RsbU (regulator of sigma subunit)
MMQGYDSACDAGPDGETHGRSSSCKTEGPMVDIALEAPRQPLAQSWKLHIRQQLLLQVLIISIIAFTAASFAIWGLHRTGALLQDVRDDINPARYADELATELQHVYGLSEAYQLSFNQPKQQNAICTEVDDSKERIIQLQNSAPAISQTFSGKINSFLQSVHNARQNADNFKPIVNQKSKLVQRELQLHAKAIEYLEGELKNETILEKAKTLSQIILAIENVHDVAMRPTFQRPLEVSGEDLSFIRQQLQLASTDQQTRAILTDAQAGLISELRARLENDLKSVGALLQKIRAVSTALSDQEITKVLGFVTDFEALFGDPRKSVGPETLSGNALQRAEFMIGFRVNSIAQQVLVKQVSAAAAEIVKKAQQRVMDAGEDANSVYKWAVWTSAVGLVASVILIIFVVSAVDRNILRRLDDITRKMRALAHGDAIAVTGAERPDELGEMARALEVFWEAELDRRELHRKLERANRELQREVDASMDVAQRIQSVLLVDELPAGPGLADQALLSRPCQLLGGDCYWLERFDNGYVVALIDCTGHGVPGAMMTIVTSIYMKSILHNEGRRDPAESLLRLANQVQSSLSKGSKDTSFDAGFDAALCIIDLKSRRLRYAGGGIPLLVLDSTSGDVRIVKGAGFGIDTIGSGPQPATQEIELRPGLRFYLASDGLVTQPDTASRRAFGWTRLTEILRDTRDLPISKQNERVWASFCEFSRKTKQRDDVTLIGFAV